MSNLPLSREEAWKLVMRYNSDRSDLTHFLESEAIMAVLAKRLGEDSAYWGMLGLLHDVDWGLTKTDSRQHLETAPAILREAGFDDAFIEIVLSHGYGWDCAGLKDMKRTKNVEFALAAAETVTGLIHAYAILRKGLEGMDAASLKKRMKEKRFAAGVNRDIIMECEQLGITLDEFLQISIDAIRAISSEVGF